MLFVLIQVYKSNLDVSIEPSSLVLTLISVIITFLPVRFESNLKKKEYFMCVCVCV